MTAMVFIWYNCRIKDSKLIVKLPENLGGAEYKNKILPPAIGNAQISYFY
jgi:hypothetical protein